MLISDFIIPFLTIALAELGDKSQVLVFLLASRTKKHLQLLIGVMLGFLIVDGIAILVGAWIVDIIPTFWLKVATGLIFIILGTITLLVKDNDKEKEPTLKNPLFTGFIMMLMAEWGDKTQIASALFATKYQPLYVFIAVMAALLVLSILAMYVGKFIAHKINKNLTKRIAGVMFIGVGLLTLFFQ